jgi:hypothetical protein
VLSQPRLRETELFPQENSTAAFDHLKRLGSHGKVSRPRIGATRFELVTSCSQGRRANQAALRPALRSAIGC